MDFFFVLLLIIIAFLYASIGHGGATGYLALMALFSIEPIVMKSSALTLNLFVASVSFLSFYRAGHFRLKLLIPFIITSMPTAYIGAMININPKIYKIILGIFLIIAVTRMVFPNKNKPIKTQKINFTLAMLIGAVLGLFSGMIGIGGGIILSPILLLLRWSNIKETAAISAIFIFLNSGAGLLGLIGSDVHLAPQILIWIFAALTGGFFGAYNASFKLESTKLTYILAFVLVLASMKLFIL